MVFSNFLFVRPFLIDNVGDKNADSNNNTSKTRNQNNSTLCRTLTRSNKSIQYIISNPDNVLFGPPLSDNSKATLTEPIDFESFVLKNKTLLQNDPQRELLLYPPDDISQVVLPRRYRTVCHSVPSHINLKECSLFTRECVKTYTCNWHLIHYKYSAYSGSYLDLPNLASNLDFGTLKGLEQSVNPQLMKYARETESSIALARREQRKRLFSIYPFMSHSKGTSQSPANSPYLNDSQQEPYKEQFGVRILVKCEEVKFRLQAPVSEDSTECTQVEPYFTTLALFDAKEGRKISEDFHFNVNSPEMQKLMEEICYEDEGGDGGDSNSCDNHVENGGDVPGRKWVFQCKQAVMSVSEPHSEIYLVLRIDKMLQGNVIQVAEPYIRSGKDPKLALKTYKSFRSTCQRIRKYRMPFAWSARPLFRLYSDELDTTSDFPALYRQDSARLKDEEILKILADYRKPDKLNKLTVIPGRATITLSPYRDPLNNSLTSDLLPLKPFPSPPSSPPTIEVAPLHPPECPHTVYRNTLYVYPESLAFESQKTFTRARNIACIVQLRDSDQENARPLKNIYSRFGALTHSACCAVLHHSPSPSWYDEIKILLPSRLSPSHHLLFIFRHISIEAAKKKEGGAETSVGYAWIPLISKGRINLDKQCIPVASHLPPGYLSVQPLGLGKGYAGPDITWVDAQKPLYTVSFTLNSTVFTRDTHLHNLFAHGERLLLEPRTPGSPVPTTSPPPDTETCKILKAAHAIQLSSVVQFLPTILNHVFRVLVRVCSASQDLSINIIRLLVHLVYLLHGAGRTDALATYAKFVFVGDIEGASSFKLSSRVWITGLCLYEFKYMGKRHIASLGRGSSSTASGNTPSLAGKPPSKSMTLPARMQPPDFSVEPSHALLSGTNSVGRDNSVHLRADSESNLSAFHQALLEANLATEVGLICLDSLGLYSVHFKDSLLASGGDNATMRSVLELYLCFLRLGQSETLFRHVFASLRSFINHFSLALFQGKLVGCRVHFLCRTIALPPNLPDLQALASVLFVLQGQLARIAMLYLPWLGIAIDNLPRLTAGVTTNYKLNPLCSVDGSEVSLASSPQRLKSQESMNGSLSNRSSLVIKDAAYFAAIAGQGLLNGASSTVSLDSESLLLSSDNNSSVSMETAIQREDTTCTPNRHSRSVSGTQVVRCDKLLSSEVKDILMCFLFLVKHLAQDQLIAWWSNSPPSHVLSFFKLIDTGRIKFLPYSGFFFQIIVKSMAQYLLSTSRIKKCLSLMDRGFVFRLINSHMSHFAAESESRSIQELKFTFLQIVSSHEHFVSFNLPVWLNKSRQDLSSEYSLSEDYCRQHFLTGLVLSEVRAALHQVLAIRRTGVLTLRDVLAKHEMDDRYQNKVRYGCVHEVHYTEQSLLDQLESCASYLEQSERYELLPHLYRLILPLYEARRNYEAQARCYQALTQACYHVVTTVRSGKRLLGNAVLCGRLCLELLRCCNSRLSVIRQESCAILYLLMRSNFEFSNRRGLTRVHLQVIISVSQLLGNIVGLNNARFQESLSLINSYATSDKVMKGTGFPLEVKDLTKRIRTVLMATAQMKELHHDPEVLSDLHHSLANSYASTPELRFTWLETMTRNHVKDLNYSEAAMCQLHIAALMAQYLKLKGVQSWGAEAFDKISSNIPRDETGLKLDSGEENKEKYSSQVTSVTPHFDKIDLESCRTTEFEQNHDVATFMFETPFTKDGSNKPRAEPCDQWKRRTIITTEYSFPYVKKRLKVVSKREIELSPIEVALDEMNQRVAELADVVFTKPTDPKKLQLRLQGSVCVQVNAGPLAYATAFLDPARDGDREYPDEKIEELKDVFREFVRVCYAALQLNSQVVRADQTEYQAALRANFHKLCTDLSNLFQETLWPDTELGSFKRNSQALFSAISGANSNSSSA
ncbi:dedicator of cytokinesis protein 11-like [Diaphorina citri]|uniref:Dedicator of cytokinesis protein 11-like n=1 Tax=Diaphorina citri TaxID=121845 RepID=A0A3Q0IMS2_DIACI|nr:dedicator of cytokinesis protein 11-like [Diaphorina citri]